MTYDAQFSQWLLYSAAAAVSTVLFLAAGTSGVRWVNRAATRIGVLSALATIFCVTATLSALMQQRHPGPNSDEPQAIEWCKRVSCTLEATAPAPQVPTRGRAVVPKSPASR